MEARAAHILRSETRSSHQAVESRGRMKRIFADDYQTGELVELLTRMFGLHAAMEHRLALCPEAARIGYLSRAARHPVAKCPGIQRGGHARNSGCCCGGVSVDEHAASMGRLSWIR